MTSIIDFHSDIQAFVNYSSASNKSLSKIGADLGLSKQAVSKKIERAALYLSNYCPGRGSPGINELQVELNASNQKNLILVSLIAKLRQELIIKSTKVHLLNVLLDKARKFMPKLKLGRLAWYDKKYLLEMLDKFQKSGGSLKVFCASIGKSQSTLIVWKKAYKEKGKAGLVNKTTRPKNFGNKVPSWIKAQLISLFLRFPSWTEYQYHCYIKNSPMTNWYVSIPTIKKLKVVHTILSEQEKDRILKRWVFSEGTEAWAVDYTTILKTANYSLKLLTVSDVKSRYLLNASLHLDTNTDQVINILEELFIKHGKPLLVKADNGPEFRLDCKSKLKDFSVYLLNSPGYYGQFCGSHERIHRTLKNFITQFSKHQNLSQLLAEVSNFSEQYNNDMKNNYLNGKTPFEVFSGDEITLPKNTEVIDPYRKDGELRFKFKNRGNQSARIALPLID